MKTCKTCRHFDEEDNKITDDYVSCRLFYVERQSGVSFDMNKFYCTFHQEAENNAYNVEIIISIGQKFLKSHTVYGIFAKNEDDAREKVSKMLDIEMAII